MQIYLVGGAVRDELLGLPVTERDWVVVGATPEKMLKLGFKAVGKDFPVFLHPETREEYALARTERKTARGHKGFICHSAPDVTLEQDLMRRDLTINAIAEDEQGQIIDPYGGAKDIQARILRHVSPAFSEDPLRILRVARFHARFGHLGFKIAPKTLKLMREMVEHGELASLSPERVWQELNKALHSQTPALFFKTLKSVKALELLFPELNIAKYKALELGVSAQLPPLLRFALIAYQLDESAFKSNGYLGKIPNEFQELALLVIRFHKTVLGRKALKPEALLNLFKQADAMRRKERFEQLMVCCETIAKAKGHAFSALAYMMALQSIDELDITPLIAQGLNGAALGKAIDALRLKVLSEDN